MLEALLAVVVTLSIGAGVAIAAIYLVTELFGRD